MAYVKTIWENLPSENTPINASNLNKMENGIYNNSMNIGELNDLDTTNKTSLVGAVNEVISNNNYSTTETNTGNTWIDGKPIYRKVIKYTTQSQEYDISGLNLDTLVRFDYYQEMNISITNNYYKRGTFYSNENDYFFMFIRNNTIQARDSADASSFIAYNIILEYTKTTD